MIRPLSELPFPAVVICPDEFTPIDTHSFVEKVLNQARFSCKKGSPEFCSKEDQFPARPLLRPLMEEVFVATAKRIYAHTRGWGIKSILRKVL